jgi:trans-aconitate 2-methyltransferase
MVTGAPREWDAAMYDALPLPHERWGARLLSTLPLEGDEVVLDVGAGTGRDTEALLRRLPRGHVIAVDASAAMLARLRSRLGSVPAQRLTVLQADLRRPLPLHRSVDAVFSVATLHWLPDHRSVFAGLRSVLRSGGRLAAEFGGAGNLAAVDAALSDLGLPPVNGQLTFTTAEQTRDALETAGFTRVDVSLIRDPAVLTDSDQLQTFLSTIVLGVVLDPLPEDERRKVVRAVADRLSRPEVDYVRAQVGAVAP